MFSAEHRRGRLISVKFGKFTKIYIIFAPVKMVDVAQLVRASDCGSEGRGFEPHLPPGKVSALPGMQIPAGFIFVPHIHNFSN